jgi:hypothetical protein
VRESKGEIVIEIEKGGERRRVRERKRKRTK